MKKLITSLLTVFLLIASVPCYAFWSPQVAPVPIDYAAHWGVGALGQAVLDNFFPDQVKTNTHIMAGVGFTKELYDSTHGGYFDWIDWGMTCLGSYMMADTHRGYQISSLYVENGLGLSVSF